MFITAMTNYGYAIIGIVLTLISMIIGFKMFDRMIPFVMEDELAKGNIAVGIVVAGMLIGVGVAVSTVVGHALN